LLVVAATLPVHPAPAAEPALTVYEITRARSGGPRDVPVYVLLSTRKDQPEYLAFHQLKPRSGGGWTNVSIRIVMVDSGNTEFAVYGAGEGNLPVQCPPADEALCGKPGDSRLHVSTGMFRPASGNRYFVVVPTDRATIYLPSQWRARRSSVAARVVTGPYASSAGTVAYGARREVFDSATAPGGKYGSSAFAIAPCETGPSAGSAALTTDGTGDPTGEITCEPGNDWSFFTTYTGRKWTLTGPVIGETAWPIRLFVVDHPKR
jgi:hypothetical protein